VTVERFQLYSVSYGIEPLPRRDHVGEMTSSSSSITIIPSTFSVWISEKLTKSNFLLSQAQVMPAIRATELEGFSTGAEKAPSKIIVSKDDKGQVVE
jgi:hypothetical protein